MFERFDAADQVELFEEFKKYNIAYPHEPFSPGSSKCHWFQPKIREAFIKVVQTLPEDAIYLELGSFLGAGSTLAALEHSGTLRAYCVDLFSMPGRVAAKFKPQGSLAKGGQPCAYMQGKGSQLQHFLNNTWAHQPRVAVFQRTVGPHFLDQLAAMGVKPNLILIDDDHHHQPVLARLRLIARHWPEAIVLLDDHTKQWDGVRTGVAAAFKEGLYHRSDSELLAHRLMMLKGKKHVDAGSEE